MSVLDETRNCWAQTYSPTPVPTPSWQGLAGSGLAWLASSQHTTSFDKPSLEWVTVTHPHHPLHGQRVQLIRVRRGPDPDLIIRMSDGYHGAIAASLTDYAGPSEPDPGAAEPPLLAIEGLWRIAQWVSQQQRPHPLPGGHEI